MKLKLLTMEVRYEHDVVLARQRARTISAALKFDVQAQTRIATAVSEVVRNAFQYAGGGSIDFEVDNGADRMLLISIRDCGPGIPNLDEIFDGKYTSKTGMGIGMVGAKRLLDRFEIETKKGKGTSITLGKIIPYKFTRLGDSELNSLLAGLERRPSENPYEELQQQNKELMRTLEELRERQAELAQLNRELDETNRGVVALYAELNDKADFLQRASELKSHFLSNMSHEFRTPLNSILALSQILTDRMDGELTEEQERQVNFIRRSAQDLTDLVSDLLDLAKVEAGKVTIRPSAFTVESLFAALRGMLRPLLAQNSSVGLVFEDPINIPELFSDEAKISQVLRNFISNALKFTERGEVRVSARLGHDGTVVFSVADTGIGIAPEDQSRIFQEWEQVEGKLQKTAKGTGLGLPLSRKLAQLIGGDVFVKSQVGVGSTFFASVPVRYAGATEAIYVPDVKRELDASKLPVLVVEDNREALFIYEKYLKGSEFQVVPAQDLKEARRALQEFRPVAIVLDVLLQGEHSWQLLQELKQSPATKDVPVFVVTVVENEAKAMAMGATAFHAKPIDRGWLLAQLQAVLSPEQSNVLIVDDDEISRYLVKGVLAGKGYRIVEARSGNEGLKLAKETRPNLIILDLSMPDLNGFEVLAALKQDSGTCGIPVVIYTSQVLDSDERARLEAAVDIVPKETKSREAAEVRFAEALMRAGLRMKANPSGVHA
ncbi:MAG TPA: ATP-binding protein [Terriglobales bacterium]|jgi:signal transduction histidine kinase/CheY-like chemotaxis protein|nr:ATP-binding protein [Terriglobales bacterium]